MALRSRPPGPGGPPPNPPGRGPPNPPPPKRLRGAKKGGSQQDNKPRGPIKERSGGRIYAVDDLDDDSAVDIDDIATSAKDADTDVVDTDIVDTDIVDTDVVEPDTEDKGEE